MAGELQASFQTGRTVYFLVRDRNALIYSAQFNGFSGYISAQYSGYVIPGQEQGASAYYVGNFPSVPAGTYNCVARQQIGAGPLESDPTTDAGSLNWNGSNVYPLSDIAVSGIVLAPTVMLARSWMVQNYPIYLRSSADHVSPLLSGFVSGQISKDGGLFTTLQSGAITPVQGGPGVYNL